MAKAEVRAGKSLLNPDDHILLMIDHQPQMAFATRSIDGASLRINATLIAEAAREFNVNLVLTTVASKSFSGPMFSEIRSIFPDFSVIDRSTMNCWEDENVIGTINKYGKRRIVLSGLWTSVCIAGPALSALEQGFEVYVITDACGDISEEAHQQSINRMIQAGVRPLTSLAYLLELQRDWGRAETYDQTTDIAQRLGGSYGLGILYAHEMFGGHEGKKSESRSSENARH